MEEENVEGLKTFLRSCIVEGSLHLAASEGFVHARVRYHILFDLQRIYIYTSLESILYREKSNYDVRFERERKNISQKKGFCHFFNFGTLANIFFLISRLRIVF